MTTPPSDRVVAIDAERLGDAGQGPGRACPLQAREDNAKAAHPKAKTGAPAAARRVRVAVRPIGGAMRATSCTPGKTYSRRPGLEIRAAPHGAS